MKNIFVVFIINNCYVRWEEFSELDILKDIFNLLKYKYLINKVMLKYNKNSYFYKDGNILLKNFFDSVNYTIKVYTYNNFLLNKTKY